MDDKVKYTINKVIKAWIKMDKTNVNGFYQTIVNQEDLTDLEDAILDLESLVALDNLNKNLVKEKVIDIVENTL